jgi:lipoprotein-anchoring transpeptidase ErfK/SrfK
MPGDPDEPAQSLFASLGESLDHTARSERGFPFVTFGDTNEMKGMSEINFGVDASFPRSIEEVRNERKWISVLLGNTVKAPIINTETEGTTLFPGEEHRCSMGRTGWSDKAPGKFLIKESAESFKLGL